MKFHTPTPKQKHAIHCTRPTTFNRPVSGLLSSTLHLLPSTLCLLTSFFLLLSPALRATTITVKQDGTGDYTHIQGAVDAAALHDTVLVWPGTYFENLHIISKPITLASLYITSGNSQYINQTIIDGGNSPKAVLDISNLPSGTIFKIYGLTVQNGNSLENPELYTLAGGGIALYYANCTVSNCIIKDNLAYGAGGGIGAWYSNLILISTTIKNNITYGYGGGIWTGGGEFLLLDTINLNNIYFNHAIMGNDICKHYEVDCSYFKLDTFTVQNDFGYCIYNYHTNNGTFVYDYQLNANHAMIEQAGDDVYVSPDGSNNNSGLTPDYPLKNIWYAMTKIQSDSNNHRTIHILPGTYSPSSNHEIIPLNVRCYSTLSGENMNTCIIDAEQNWFHLSCHPQSSGINIKNLSFINGNSLVYLDYWFDPGSIDMTRAVDNLLIDNVKFSDNIGLSSSACRLTILRKSFLSNIHASNNYGGRTVSANYASENIDRAIVARNIAINENSYYGDGYGFSGGGFVIGCSYTQTHPLIPTVANIQVCNNKMYDSWGGADFLACFLVNGRSNFITNATITGNQNENQLPGAYATWENMKSYVYNSVFYDNEHPQIVLGVEPPLNTPGELYIDYCLIEQGLDDIWNQQNFNILHYGANNIEGNPLFKGTGEHPYQLQAGSPCIDAGTPMYEPGMQPPYIKEENGKYVLYTHSMDTLHLPATDLAGNPRISGGRIDMGAYEFTDTTQRIGERPKYLGGEITAAPNPMQESTEIRFTLLAEGHLQVQVHSLQGRLLNTLIDAQTQPGNFRVRWHADDTKGNKLPPGYYLVSVILNGETLSTVKVNKLGTR